MNSIMLLLSLFNTLAQTVLCSRVLSLLMLYSMIVDLNVNIYVAALRDIFLTVDLNLNEEYYNYNVLE